MSDRAYAVLFIAPGTPSVVTGAGIFGEPNPTTTMRVRTVALFDQTADSFADAAKRCEEMLCDPFYDWCGELRQDPHRGWYRDARQASHG